jgi:hypothetical protein
MTVADLLQLCFPLGLTPMPVWHYFPYGKVDDIHSVIQEWQSHYTRQGYK